MTQPQSQASSTTQKPNSSEKANPTLLIPQPSCYLGHIQYTFHVPVLQPYFPSWISPHCNPSALTFGTVFFWLFLNHSLDFFFFFVNSSDLLYMVHSTCLWTPSMHPNPVLLSHPYLPPNIKPTPAQPHRLFKKDLGNRTELYFREINLTTMCRAGWRQQASWEPSTECENLNMELTGNGK